MSVVDWVMARSNCTIRGAFDQLADGVKADLMCFKRLHPGPAQSLEFGECDKNRFFVGHQQVHRVVFEQVESEIRIGRWAYSGEHTPLMVLTVRLDDDGECVLIDEAQKVWKPWQVRRIALEETLFGAP